MGRTEQIIYEAKEAGKEKARREAGIVDSRRPSTTVDETGCVIQRGFLIPASRSSSQASLARTATNSSFNSTVSFSASFGADIGTPATPVESPRPGYARPTGSLYHAPEFRRLRNESASSLLLPIDEPSPPKIAISRPRSPDEFHRSHCCCSRCFLTRSATSDTVDWTPLTRPQMGNRRQTAPNSKRVSRISPNSYIHNEELEAMRCKAQTGRKPMPPPAAPKAEPMPGVSASLLSQHLLNLQMKQTIGKARSVPEAQPKTNRIDGQCSAPGAKRRSSKTESMMTIEDDDDQATASDSKTKPKMTIGDDDAIASDSEDDFINESGIAFQRKRKTYAARRAESDAKGIRICRDGVWEADATKPF